MNKQLLAKDDRIHNLEIRNQNLENEIRYAKSQLVFNFQGFKNVDQLHSSCSTLNPLLTSLSPRTLKDQNAQLSRTQQSEEEHKKLLDKVASLRRKLSDMEVKHAKMKEEKEGEERSITYRPLHCHKVPSPR